MACLAPFVTSTFSRVAVMPSAAILVDDACVQVGEAGPRRVLQRLGAIHRERALGFRREVREESAVDASAGMRNARDSTRGANQLEATCYARRRRRGRDRESDLTAGGSLRMSYP